MKKLLTLATLVSVLATAQAQQQPTNKQTKKDNRQTGQTQNTNPTTNRPQDQQATHGHMNNGGTTQSSTAMGGDTSGTMMSTGRYAAMGVQQGSLHRKDLKFAVLAASSNSLELSLSQLALQRATNPAVRDYANMMVQHHTMAAQDMKTLLSAKGAMIPDSTYLPMHRTQMEMVMAAQGADFDKAYMRIMVDAHEEDLDEFEDETTDARDADIRAFATRMMPVLRTHYNRAKEVRKMVR